MGAIEIADDISDGYFAAALVAYASYDHFDHAGLLGQKLLNFARVDVEATGND